MIYATTAQAAQYLNIPQTTIRWWAHIGKCQQYGSPRQRLYDLEELINLLDKPTNATLSSVGDLSPQNNPATECVRGSCMIGDAHGAH